MQSLRISRKYIVIDFTKRPRLMLFRSLRSISRKFSIGQQPPWDIPTLDSFEDLSSLTPRQQELRMQSLEFALKHIEGHALNWENSGYFPKEEFQSAAELGYTQLYVPGEKKFSVLEGSLIMQGLAHSCATFSAVLSVHNLCNYIINKAATVNTKLGLSELINKYLDSVCFCLTQPSAGSDARGIKTTAQKDASGNYVINGEKTFISGGQSARFYIVAALTASNTSSLLLIDKLQEKQGKGIKVEAIEQKMGWKFVDTATLKFQNCVVPAENLLGREGDGFKLAMETLEFGRINIASSSMGAAAAALCKTIHYAKERKQFGKSLSNMQSVQFKISDMMTDLATSRLMVRRAAQMVDSRHPDAGMHVAMAKRFATDACSKIVDEAIQIHGGYGYLAKYGLEKAYRDIRAHQILEGTNDIMKMIISRKLLK